MNKATGLMRSLSLTEFLEPFKNKDVEIVNLQYGDCKKEIAEAFEKTGIAVKSINEIDTFTNDNSTLCSVLKSKPIMLMGDSVMEELWDVTSCLCPGFISNKVITTKGIDVQTVFRNKVGSYPILPSFFLVRQKTLTLRLLILLIRITHLYITHPRL